MSLLPALILIVVVIVIYLTLVKVYSVLFRMTGISKDTSKFQTISMLTNSGYTTRESEIFVSDKFRKNITTAAMVTGYFFSVLGVSLLVNLFMNINYADIGGDIILLLIFFGSLLLVLLFFKIPPISRALDHLIEKVANRIFMHSSKDNYISIVESYGEDVIAKVYLSYVPSFLEGITISKSILRKKYNINIIMYIRKDHVHQVTKDTIFTKGDVLMVFGKNQMIHQAFSVKGEIIRKEKHENEISVIESLPSGVLAEIKCVEVPKAFRGKTIKDAGLKDYYGINLIMIERNGESIDVGKNTTIENNDLLIAFGQYENLVIAFHLSDKDFHPNDDFKK